MHYVYVRVQEFHLRLNKTAQLQGAKVGDHPSTSVLKVFIRHTHLKALLGKTGASP